MNLSHLAVTNHHFESIEPENQKSFFLLFSDEFPKHGTTAESLAKLRPCFDKSGSVTPGNASGINDSAAAVLLMSQTEAQKRGATPLARIVAFGQAGVDPTIMGMGASAAVQVVVSLISQRNYVIPLVLMTYHLII